MTIAEQLISKGRQEGMQEGMQQGRQQGMQQEAAKTLLKILNKRYGAVSPTIQEQIGAATSTQLEAWIDASLDADRIEQIFKG